MDSALPLILVVAFAMLVYFAVSARALVRMRRARALVVAADVPELADSGQLSASFATLKAWYAGKPCEFCKRPIAALHYVGPKPGLIRRGAGAHPVLTWDELPGEPTPQLLDTYMPLCPDCQIAESFRQQFPDRMTVRPGVARG